MNLQYKLKVTPRSQTGRSASRRLRKTNQIPAILYGKHSNPETLSIDGPEFGRLVKSIAGKAALIELDRNGGDSKTLTFLQEIQRDPMTDRYVHVDLHEVKADERFDIRDKVQPVGESHGGKNQSGVLETPTFALRVRCLPKDLPPVVEVDVTELKVGETIHVGEIKPIPGVEFLDAKHQPVVSCVEPVAEIVTEVAAEVAPTAEGEAAAAGAAVPGAPGTTPAAPGAAAPAAAGDAKGAAAASGDKKAGAPAAGKPAAPAPAKK